MSTRTQRPGRGPAPDDTVSHPPVWSEPPAVRTRRPARRRPRRWRLVGAAAGVLAATLGVAVATVVVGNLLAEEPRTGEDTSGFGAAPDGTGLVRGTPPSDGERHGDPATSSSEASPRPDDPDGPAAGASAGTSSGDTSSQGTTGPAGWPGPDNTGVPAGTQLTSSGSFTVEDGGAVISGLDIDGCVTVKASNVTIKKSRISCGGTYPVKVESGFSGLLLEDVEIDGEGQASTAICCGGYTLRRANIHDTIDGPRLGSGTVVEDSWVHHLSRVGSSHNDTLQTTGGTSIVVRNNRLEVYNPTTGDLFNAAIMIGSNTTKVSDLLFENNYCNGGNYTIGIREDLDGANIVIRRNTFGRDYRYGVVAHPDGNGVTWERSTNIFADTGKPVT